MSLMNFMIGIHNHQPVGNFGHVMEESYEKCYGPQIEILKSHPGVRMAIHHSGPLLEWIEDNRPRYLDDIGRLVEKGQVEILSGGFYEPILASLPADDAIGQIAMMNEYVKKRFGVTPQGMWLAERIWDPSMPEIISAAGIRYTLLDDTHFHYAGLGAREMFGYYITEKRGATTAVFPIDKTLRYYIPFKPPEDTVEYLNNAREQEGVNGATYGDDGEKFGVWPETYEWVYGQKWLEKFYTTLEDSSGQVKMTLFSEYLAQNPPMGRVYIPPASYEEMGQWTLPSMAQKSFEHILKELDEQGRKEEYKPFIRGGMWDNFLAKYEEANRMHKKMLYVSSRVKEAGEIANSMQARAREALYKGQCNCAYWHGLFGGLYLNYLRHAIYANLIDAENMADLAQYGKGPWVRMERMDIDADGLEEIILKNPNVSAMIKPGYGGSVFSLEYRPALFALTNTLSRRQEAYHEKILNAASHQEAGEGAPASIHDIVKFKEEGLERYLAYDRYSRGLFQDNVIPGDVNLDSYMTGDFEQLADFVDQAWTVESAEEKNDAASVTLVRQGMIISDGEPLPASISKTFSLDASSADLSAEYTIANKGDGPLNFRLAVEFNMTMLAADAGDRLWTGGSAAPDMRLKERVEDHGAQWVGMKDGWARFSAIVYSSRPFDAFRFPVETVSQSESGFERTYQGSCMALLLDINLPAGGHDKFTLGVKMVDEK